ncbi:hypothetical protein PAXRUDRAFT_17896 [Paxillus rubicundulus Ve08.2h10]|uniref:Uncharacterized protein n=1 Tax=Paxillus rubicundulus Ve08.2h10 TaxID=930991 RepID=A0A0D0D8W7_9AGAM|nr:hypothetical protein PAXRUDRAFT_17896 [Paxillus rubicundulus Ve08.2h10]
MGKKSDFMKAQLQATLYNFWSSILYLEFFEKWPEVDNAFPGKTYDSLTEDEQKVLGEQVKTRKGQIQLWFYGLQASSKRGRASGFSKCITKVMSANLKGTHGPSAIEVFLCDNNDIKINVSMQVKVGTIDKIMRLTEMQSLAEHDLANKSEEFRENLVAQAKEECQRHAEAAVADVEALCAGGAEQQIKAIEGLSGMFGDLLNTVFQLSGWHASVYVGGPDPRLDGQLRVYR